MAVKDKQRKLRSTEWFGRQDKDGFAYRSWMKNQGLPHHLLMAGRLSVFATPGLSLPRAMHICVKLQNASSVVCTRWAVFPSSFLSCPLGETLLRPTAMLFRNLASMDVENPYVATP